MSQEDSKHEGNKDIVIEIKEFSDSRLGYSNQEEDKNQTIIPENLQNYEQNYENKLNHKKGKKKKEK